MIPSISNKIRKISFLQWAGLRHSIPDFLKDDCDYIYTLTPSSLQINNNIFDVKEKKSKDYYSLLVIKKSQPPNIVHKWKSDFNISDDLLRESFILPHSVLLHLNPMLRLFSIKSLTIYSTQTRNCVKLALELMTYALSAKLSEKCYITCLINALMGDSSGMISNCTGSACQIR